MIRIKPKFRLYKNRNKPAYYIIILCGILAITTLLYINPWNTTTKNRFVSYSNQDLDSGTQHPFHKGCNDVDVYINDPLYQRANASFVMLTRNKELEDVVVTLTSIESHFNQWYNYPYVFLNDEPFTDEFKETVRKTVTAPVEFGTLKELEWDFPKEVRETIEFTERIKDQADRGVMYGDVESYHKMCRFYSGLFYKHPLVRAHEWYWRIEPDVKFFCDITYDPFYEMTQNGKEYGFTVIMQELYWSIPGLFRATRSYINSKKLKVGSLWKLFTDSYSYVKTDDEHLKKSIFDNTQLKEKVEEKVHIDHLIDQMRNGQVNLNDERNSLGLSRLIDRAQSKIPIFEDKFNDEDYNLCHFWSNFEIARRTVFDNDVYDGYFKHLESTGGFWKERWGDAPVHSLGLALTLNVEQIHYFRDIGYQHSFIVHCPKNAPPEYQLPYVAGDNKFSERKSQYDNSFDFGSGCRCDCPPGHIDIEDTSYPCIDFWLELAHGMEKNSNFVDGAYHPYIDLDSVVDEMKSEFNSL